MLKLVGLGDFRERLRTQPTELHSLVWETIERVGPFVRARSLHLDAEVAADLGFFEIDADKIRDVLMNLLTNAIKFTPDHGAIRLTARLVEPDAAEIQVADRGIGLEPRALNRLFSPFFTEFDPKSHSSGEYGFGKRGLGLGLYLVKTFVEMHGGTVSAQSVPDQGTSVTIHLPRKPCAGPGSGVEWEEVHTYSDPEPNGYPTGV